LVCLTLLIGLKMGMSNILITGGSGMVGKSLKKILPNATYISSKDCDLTNEDSVMCLMKNNKYDVVVHLAARVGGIIDNINSPEEYFIENIQMNTNIVKWSRLTGVKRFIGILSTCIYPDIVDEYPMKEDVLHDGPPTPTNFSYGYAKRCLAVHIDACNKQYGTKYQYLIPCNLYGENDKFGENSHFIAALVKKIVDLEKNENKNLILFGTGKPLRQFMHSDDLSWVINECLEKEIYDNFNVATEENLSIKDMAEIAIKSCGLKNINVTFDPTKPDGQYRKDVSIDKLKSLLPNFNPISLEKGIKKVYDKIS
jgi:GDP-L-fucose synthase